MTHQVRCFVSNCTFVFPGCQGNPTVCGQDSVSVTLVGCLLAEKGIDYTMLHLNDPSCRGQIDEVEKTVTLSFNSSNFCGTVISVGSVLSTSSQISFSTLWASPTLLSTARLASDCWEMFLLRRIMRSSSMDLVVPTCEPLLLADQQQPSYLHKHYCRTEQFLWHHHSPRSSSHWLLLLLCSARKWDLVPQIQTQVSHGWQPSFLLLWVLRVDVWRTVRPRNCVYLCYPPLHI